MGGTGTSIAGTGRNKYDEDQDPDIQISIKGLTKSFGPQTVLEDLTFDIPRGRITLILGPSGTGKSVFLKHLVGLLKPDRGEIWIDEHNVPALREKELYQVRRKFGVLFQDGALFGSMNVFDNVAFPLREHTKKREGEIRDIVNEKLTMVGLTGAEKKLPGEISGGMKKRAGLARALVLDPEIILFDEPDSGLDPVRTAFLNELIMDLSDQLQATFIVVTHDISTARKVSDYIGMLYRRNLVRFGPARDMFESDIPVVRQFLSGDTDGPIGMSEEKDSTKSAQAQSSSGMTAEETEAMERDAGAPGDSSEDEGAGRSSGRSSTGDSSPDEPAPSSSADDPSSNGSAGNGRRFWGRRKGPKDQGGDVKPDESHDASAPDEDEPSTAVHHDEPTADSAEEEPSASGSGSASSGDTEETARN